MIRQTQHALVCAAVAVLAFAAGAGAGYALRGPLPLADALTVPEPGVTSPAVYDLDRTPTAADTAGTVPQARVTYADRWDVPPAADVVCPPPTPASATATAADTAGTAAADSFRVAVVPRQANPLVALPRDPVRVSPSRVVLSYRRAEGPDAGQTVTDVWSVPPRRLAGSLDAALSYRPHPGPLPAWTGGLDARLRVGRATFRAGVLLDLDTLAASPAVLFTDPARALAPSTVGVRYRLFGTD
jgi:hypothetical protein